MGNAHPGVVHYQVFHTADTDVVIAVGSDKQWAQFCAVLGLGAEVRDDARFATNPARLAHRAEVVPLLQARLALMASDDVLAQLQAAEIPCGPINSIPDSLSDAHYQARGNIVDFEHPTAGTLHTLANPLRLSDTPPTYRLPPPRLGEHTAAVLAELGYSAGEIATLQKAGTV